MISSIAAAATAIIQSISPIQGWTEADILAALNDANVSDVTVDTADPNFPSVGARTADGFPVSIVRMACQDMPPGPETLCRGAWVNIGIPATEPRYGGIIIGSLERQAQPPLGVNGSLQEMRGEDGSASVVVMLSSYLVSDDGVHPGLLSFTVNSLLGYAAQTRDFMLRDDPSHAALWSGEN